MVSWVWHRFDSIATRCIEHGFGMPVSSQFHRFSVASRTQPLCGEWGACESVCGCVRVRSSKSLITIRELICFLVFASPRRTPDASWARAHVTSDCFMNPICIITESKQEYIIPNVLCSLPRDHLDAPDSQTTIWTACAPTDDDRGKNRSKGMEQRCE